VLVDRHHRQERPDHRPCLVDLLALHRRCHHRRRTLADAAALTPYLDIGHDAVLDDEVDRDLVAAQRVHALRAHGRRHRQLSLVAGIAVVIEDDLSVQVFESGHRGFPFRYLAPLAWLRW
jgi:hypothetical protein